MKLPYKDYKMKIENAAKWNREHREERNFRTRQFYQMNKARILEKNRLWRENNREKDCETKKKYNRKIRELVLEHYGNKCVCCGEQNKEFLQIDHINNDGAQHRKILKMSIYRWAINNNFPTTLQILCANCNHSKEKYGYCPHKRK